MRTAAAVLKILNGRVGRGCIGTHSDPCGLLTGSWAAISGVVSRVTLIVTHNNKDLITLLITTHEPPSRLGDWEVWLRTLQWACSSCKRQMSPSSGSSFRVQGRREFRGLGSRGVGFRA